LEWGLANEVHPDDELAEATGRLATRLAAGPTRSYAGSKRALNRVLYPDMQGQLELEAETQHALARSPDFLEGVTAFVEKRQPEFKGQ
ncbi:MAG: enoyl-CoA hydratase-related protein, partial [Solirubrobacteraceae bacterium]